jgi:hypothetical protein
MGQEFLINSQELESKVRDLLPSQGGFGAGQDLSASTQIVPIIDLTETAEGSNVRADLQTALSFNSVTAQQVSNGTVTLINSTGYFRVFGCNRSYGSTVLDFSLTDGATSKKITEFSGASGQTITDQIDFIVFLAAGDSLTATSSNASGQFVGATRQIADINGNLVDPS